MTLWRVAPPGLGFSTDGSCTCLLAHCAVLEMHPRTFCYYWMVLDMECINRVALDCIETGGSILEESKFYKLNIKIS